MLAKFQPSRDRVLIKRLEEDDVTSGGIIRPDTAKQKGQKGTVLAVGPGKLDTNGNQVAMAINAGDMVYFAKYAGTELDDDHLVLGEDDILGIIQK